MADFWKIVEVNTGICVPKYLKNVLMLYGYDDASSIESITMEDIDSIEEFVKSGIDEHVGDGEATDVYHRFPNRKYQFIVTKGDRVKLMDVVKFVRNKLASEGGYKFFYRSAEIIQQTLKPTFSKSLHSQELPAIFHDDDVNQSMKTERNSNDRQLLVSSTTSVLKNSHDDAIIAKPLPTKQNRITSVSSEDKSDENLLVPLRFRTPSPLAIKILSRHENVKVEVENDTKDDVDFTKDCEKNTTKSTSYLSKENQITVLPPNLKHCQVKILQSPQIGNSSRINQPPLAHKVKGLKIPPPSDVDRESIIGDKTLRDENSVIQRCSCDICGKICKSKDRIKQHMKLHTGVKLHVCSFCGYATPLNSVLQHHLRIHTGEKPYVCDVCSKSFIEASKLSQHKRIHTGEKPFVCDVCSKAFRCATNLFAHKRIHTGEKPYVCNVCTKSFIDSSKLSDHKRIHTGEKPFVCHVCSKAFRYSTNLSDHKRIHTGEKPFVCHVCSKAFRCSTNLSLHKRIHTGERFACDVCPKTFSQASKLLEHKRIHTGERFACDVCPKTFSHSSNLSGHKKTHSGERFACDDCPKTFSHSPSLSAHKRIHTGGRFACGICPKTFGQSAHLSVHKRFHTGEKECLP